MSSLNQFRESVETALPSLSVKKIHCDHVKQIITITFNEIWFSIINAESVIKEYKPAGILIVVKKDIVKLININPETVAQNTVHWFMYGRKFLSPPKHFNCKCSSIILESKEDFKRQYECSFEPDERSIALQDRLIEYYKSDELPININDRYIHFKAFKKWCDERGYSQGEINNAKMRVNR